MLKTGLIWAALLALSVLAVAAFEAARLPAALLLGCMVAAIGVGAASGGIAVPRVAFVLAQGIVGCLIARSIPLAILGTIVADWPLFLATVIAVVGACTALGWVLARYRVLPGTVAIWGLSPGAASVMTIMAGEFGSDMRLVAFMQYFRVVCVSALAPVVARLWTHAAPGVACLSHSRRRTLSSFPLLPGGGRLRVGRQGYVQVRRCSVRSK